MDHREQGRGMGFPPDTSILEKALLRYGATLLNDIKEILGDEQDALDILQEAVTSSLLALNRGSVIRHPGGYLYKACTRLATRYADTILAPEHAPPDMNQDQEIRLDADFEALQILLLVKRRLDRKGRLVLRLLLRGYTNTEMTTLTGYGRFTIASRVTKIQVLTKSYWRLGMQREKQQFRKVPTSTA